ncbi:DUF1682 domain-containing protein [Rhodobacter calidifons]|uniref:DUF1682 domain-containing protein n=1 Tax=Rhodobacter calidifons TaxID=2715277 RepID=A0ABX0G2Z1_9RHOB|nr:DUF1682 domain-containing protein [Rhodobacter calidifons]NHB75572.1 DUF1682 domain-containing protein [Rhodobacter calidifons]
MPVNRPNLRNKALAAQLREQEIKAARKAAKERGVKLSDYERKLARDAKWEKLGAEKQFYSQSGLGPPPWEQKLTRWALVVFAIGLGAIVLLRVM